MHPRPLGRSGLAVSPICLGTMTFGEQNTEAEGHEQMDRAVAAGIDFFDAAELYPIPPKPETQGRTEEIIGTWLKSRGLRGRIVVATKVCGRSQSTWFRRDGSTCRLDRRQVEEAVEGSLRRLQTDVIDLYQIHWPDRPVVQFGSVPMIWRDPGRVADEVPIAETLEVLGDLLAAGKIRHYGLSNESPWGTMKWLAEADRLGLPRPASIQNAYSLINRTYEVGLAEVTMREEISLLAYSPLGQGYLSGKYRGGALPPGARKTLFNRLQRYETPYAGAAIDAYVELAGERGLDPSQLAIAFALSRPFTTSVIIGATTMAQLETDLGAIDLDIDDDLEAAINAIHLRYPNPAP